VLVRVDLNVPMEDGNLIRSERNHGFVVMKLSDKRATAELLAALVEVAIAHGRRHYSESGEPLATTLAVLECLRREGLVTVEGPTRRGSAPAPAAGTP